MFYPVQPYFHWELNLMSFLIIQICLKLMLWKYCWFLSVVAFLLSSAVCLCLSSPPHKCQCSNYRHRIKFKVFCIPWFHARNCDSDYFAFACLRLYPILFPPRKCPCSNHRRRWRTSSCNCWFRTSGFPCTPCRCCSHLNESVYKLDRLKRN